MCPIFVDSTLNCACINYRPMTMPKHTYTIYYIHLTIYLIQRSCSTAVKILQLYLFYRQKQHSHHENESFLVLPLFFCDSKPLHTHT